jgi:chemotaxis response regulator CheB
VQFAPGLANWLASQTALPLHLAEEGDYPEAGTILVAGKEAHLVLTPSARWGYMRARADCAHRPSVDVFFESVSQHWKGMAVGVLLTGMGRDGAAGLRMLRQHGHHTIAQDQATSGVYGMPKAAVELNAATEILALDKIGARLSNIVAGKTRA